MNLYRIGQEEALRKLGMDEGAGAAAAHGGGGDAGNTSGEGSAQEDSGGEKRREKKEREDMPVGPPPGMAAGGMPPMEDAGAEGGELADLPPELMTELGGAEEVGDPMEEALAGLSPEMLEQLVQLIQAQDQQQMGEGAPPPPPEMGGGEPPAPPMG